MNLTRLQTFVEVVRRGTFASAADALSFTPSAVSQQMAKLEAEAGMPLLAREGGGGVRLTEAGQLLHQHAVGIVDAVHRARLGLIALQAAQVKRLRIAACPVAAGAVVPRALPTRCRPSERWPRSRRCGRRRCVSVAHRRRQQCLWRASSARATIVWLELLDFGWSPACRRGGPPEISRAFARPSPPGCRRRPRGRT